MTLLVQNKLTKLYNYEHKISKRFTQADYSNTKAQPTFDQIIDIPSGSDIKCILYPGQ